MILVPLVAATSGVMLSLGASILSASSGADFAPYVGGVGNGLAVVGLVFVLRAVLSGTLIARPVAEVEAKLLSLVEQGHQREKAYELICKRRSPK